jgi:Flp pilus assembly protein TadG
MCMNSGGALVHKDDTSVRAKSGRKRTQLGQTLVEFALVLPVLLYVMMGIIDFGRILFTYSQASNTLRDALRYATATGFDEDNPQYADCATIANTAANRERIWFASDVEFVVYYDAAPVSADTVDPDNPASEDYVFRPGDDPTTVCDPMILKMGDQITVQTTVYVDVITPLISGVLPTLDFSLGGTRTLTVGGVSYGVDIATLNGPENLEVTCNQDISGYEYVEMTWRDDNPDSIADEYWIYSSASTYAIGQLEKDDADDVVGDIGDFEFGCTGSHLVDDPWSPAYSCYNARGPLFGDTIPRTYYARAYDVELGVGPVFAATAPDGGDLISCPEPAPPAAPDVPLTSDGTWCGLGTANLELSWGYSDSLYPGNVNIVQYRIYKDALGDGPDHPDEWVGTVQGNPPELSCSGSKCDPGWDGSAEATYYVVAFNGMSSLDHPTGPTSVGPLIVPECTHTSPFYLQPTDALEDSAVPHVDDFSNAMSFTCGYRMEQKFEPAVGLNGLDYYWLSEQAAENFTQPAGTYRVDLDIPNQIQKPNTINADLTVRICPGTPIPTDITACELPLGTVSYAFEYVEGLTSVSIPIPVAEHEIPEGHRLVFGFDIVPPDSIGKMEFGFGGCSDPYDSQVVFVP